MLYVVRQWWPILAAVGLIQIGNGISGTLFALEVDARGLQGWEIGLLLCMFYAGSTAGPFLAPVLIRRIAHIGTIVVFALLSALSVAGLAFAPGALTLALLRAGQGIGLSAFYAAIESWLNLGTEDRWRARVFAMYILVQLIGLASGQLLLNARGMGEMALFLLAATLIASPAAVVGMAPHKNPQFETPTPIGMIALARRAPLGVVAVLLSGFTWAGIMATGPVFAQRIGLGDFDKSLFMALPIIGGVIAQFPLGWLADHNERRVVLSGMSVAAALFAAFGAVASPGVPLFIAIAGFGAMALPLYAVAVALTNEVLSQDHRIAASASMVIYFGAGAVAGPSVTALVMDSWGPDGFFLAQGVGEGIFAAAVLLSLIQLRRRPAS